MYLVNDPNVRKLIVGCGYVGKRIARAWLDGGSSVYAVTRSPERAATLGQIGIEPIVADVTVPDSLTALPEVDTVLYAVGFDRNASRTSRTSRTIWDVYVDGLSAVLEGLKSSQIKRFIYISSTGVYGQDDGSWVDEDSPCEPIREGGLACLAAESRLRGHPLGQVSVVLRLAGIYGPGRVPRKTDLESTRPFRAATTGYLNLIHVDDVVQAVLASERIEPTPRLYVISDGCPVPRLEYYRELSRLLGVGETTFCPPDSASAAAQRSRASKRIRSDRAIRELEMRLFYPSYKEGLAAILDVG